MTTSTQAPGVGIAPNAADARRQAVEIKQRWRDGEPPDAAAALADHPELLAFRSLVVALAYEEYCLREEGDGAPDVAPFCARLPAFRGSVRKVIEAHRMIDAHPEVLSPEPVWPEPRDTFDGLEVVTELGRGTFARAYLAYDPQTDRGCVLKLSPGRGGEGRALGPLHHPHITDVYWADRGSGLDAVCMPLLGVTTLEDVRDAAFPNPEAVPMSAAALLDAIQSAVGGLAAPAPVVAPGESYPAAVVAVAARIADALAYLHGQNREHGDLKPSNVVLAPGGHPYLIDFNLSADDPATAPLSGTVPYMAPERLERLTSPGAARPVVDRVKADVYSLGVVLYELLTGRLPWAPNPKLGPLGAAADLLARRAAGVAWPETGVVPEPVARLVESCLADAPAVRPAAAAAAAALARWLSDERGESIAPAPKRRRVLPFALTGGLAVAAVIGLAAALRPVGAPVAAVPVAAPAVVPEPPLAVAPRPRPAPFPAGLEKLRAGEFEDAFGYFRAAEDGNKALALAYQSYCYGRRALASDPVRPGLLNAARALGETARDAGADWATFNNLGLIYFERHHEYDKAARHLDLAVKQDPTLTAARYNRANLRYVRLCAATPSGLARFETRDAANDIIEALKHAPESLLFHHTAAHVLAASSHHGPDLRGRAIDCLRKVVELGHDPHRLKKDAMLHTNLKDDPGYEAFLSLPAQPVREGQPEFRLVEPVQR